MLHEQMQNPDFVRRDFGDLLLHDRGDEVGAPRLGGEGELFLEPRHCACSFCFCYCCCGVCFERCDVAGCWGTAVAGWEERGSGGGEEVGAEIAEGEEDGVEEELEEVGEEGEDEDCEEEEGVAQVGVEGH